MARRHLATPAPRHVGAVGRAADRPRRSRARSSAPGRRRGDRRRRYFAVVRIAGDERGRRRRHAEEAGRGALRGARARGPARHGRRAAARRARRAAQPLIRPRRRAAPARGAQRRRRRSRRHRRRLRGRGRGVDVEDRPTSTTSSTSTASVAARSTAKAADRRLDPRQFDDELRARHRRADTEEPRRPGDRRRGGRPLVRQRVPHDRRGGPPGDRPTRDPARASRRSAATAQRTPVDGSSRPSRLDLEAIIAGLDPDKLRALQRYAPLFLDDAQEGSTTRRAISITNRSCSR